MWNYKSDICCTPILEPVIQPLAASFRDDVIAVKRPELNLAAKLDFSVLSYNLLPPSIHSFRMANPLLQVN